MKSKIVDAGYFAKDTTFIIEDKLWGISHLATTEQRREILKKHYYSTSYVCFGDTLYCECSDYRYAEMLKTTIFVLRRDHK